MTHAGGEHSLKISAPQILRLGVRQRLEYSERRLLMTFNAATNKLHPVWQTGPTVKLGLSLRDTFSKVSTRVRIADGVVQPGWTHGAARSSL